LLLYILTAEERIKMGRKQRRIESLEVHEGG
jgi:hypothetical protein